MLIAAGLWLMAIWTGRPRPISSPVLAPPPPANRSTLISSSISDKGRPYCPRKAMGGIWSEVIGYLRRSEKRHLLFGASGWRGKNQIGFRLQRSRWRRLCAVIHCAAQGVAAPQLGIPHAQDVKRGVPVVPLFQRQRIPFDDQSGDAQQ